MTWSSASPRQLPGGAASKGPDYQDPGIDPVRLRNGCLEPLEEGGELAKLDSDGYRPLRTTTATEAS